MQEGASCTLLVLPHDLHVHPPPFTDSPRFPLSRFSKFSAFPVPRSDPDVCVQRRCLMKLQHQELARIASSCRTFRHVASDGELWRLLFARTAPCRTMLDERCTPYSDRILQNSRQESSILTEDVLVDFILAFAKPCTVRH